MRQMIPDLFLDHMESSSLQSLSCDRKISFSRNLLRETNLLADIQQGENKPWGYLYDVAFMHNA